MTPVDRDDLPAPIVIAHRGASGYRPEHTLEAYRLAIEQGADFIEPDLVVTKDGVLVARHENELSGTTDVADHPEFASRRATKRVDGVERTGWFTEDFTLAELKTLRAKERIPEVRPANARHDGRFEIPTFAEVIRLAASESHGGRVVGVYPETKHPTYFAYEGRRLDGGTIGVSPGRTLVETLVAEGFTDPRRVFIQSFEVGNLIELETSIMPAVGVGFPLVQLFDNIGSAGPYDFRWNVAQGADLHAVYGGLVDVVGGIDASAGYQALAIGPALRWMRAHYASGIGPWKGDILPRSLPQPGASRDGDAQFPTRRHGLAHAFMSQALEAGLVVHPYTLRAEEASTTQIPPGVDHAAGQGRVIAEAVQLYRLGAQGVFIDQPDLGVAARDLFLRMSRR